ncbi:MAG: molybdopterin guanine dinucleotide-containing S/N-oxide reductase [Alphaproteobacteria bacterium]
MAPPQTFRTATHWGSYDAEVVDGKLTALNPIAADPDPSPIGAGMARAIQDDLRIQQPMVRAGWLENGPNGPKGKRGAEPFVPVSWDRALDLAAAETERVRTTFGNESIYAGSYGWGSAGCFHHAQSHMRRFLNLIGGNVKSVNSYSLAAAQTIVPHVVGDWTWVYQNMTSWSVIAEHTDLVVAFGGVPLKNAQVDGGGVGRHRVSEWLKTCGNNDVTFMNIGPVREDIADFAKAEWLTPRPNTDTAVMLGLAHTLVRENLHDVAFLNRCATGFDRFAPYLLGETDGTPKDADWAAGISGLAAEDIRALARRMAAGRTLLTAAWSLQRGDHGEQPYWMLITLAAMLGQIGLPGGGFGFGYGAVSNIGSSEPKIAGPYLSSGHNPLNRFIPVARIADMLLNPGGTIDYNGEKVVFPDTRLIFWCGGNPFHHHQDLNRLVRAWQQPDTIIVNEPWWNSLARHADIVFPATTALERNDIGSAYSDKYLFAMQRAVAPVGESRSDFEIYGGLADRFGVREAYSEGRDEMGWLRYLYNRFRQSSAEQNIEVPDFETFWKQGEIELPVADRRVTLMEGFRADPEAAPLKTPSGKIEIYSETIASFGYDDCPPHPTWMAPAEWLGSPRAAQFPLHLISNQPRTRLHSQYDNGGYAQASKVKGREPILIHPSDAAARGIADGDIVRVFNDRGACLAGAVVTDGVQASVVQLPTGAWYDPVEPGGLEAHGNPNVLTMDKGTSKLAQGPSAHSALVQIEKFDGTPPPVRVFTPPPMVSRLRKAR